MRNKQHKIGIISDTHGVLPGRVYDIFADVERIIHAGDVGHESVLSELQSIAPVAAVYGNVDGRELRARMKERLEFSIDGFGIIVTHYPLYFGEDDESSIRISGHTHRPLLLQRGGSWLINPGSACFPRGEYKPSVALLTLADAEAQAKIVYF